MKEKWYFDWTLIPIKVTTYPTKAIPRFHSGRRYYPINLLWLTSVIKPLGTKKTSPDILHKCFFPLPPALIAGKKKNWPFDSHQIGSSTIHFGLSNGGTVGGGMPIRHSFHQLTSGLPNKMHSGNASADRECSQHSDVRKWRGYDNAELKTLN